MEEYEILSNSEKALSIRSKIKNIQYVKYNVELDILAENAISNPSEALIHDWTVQLSDLNAKEAALQNELDEVLGNV